jgi:hypothetical protein
VFGQTLYFKRIRKHPANACYQLEPRDVAAAAKQQSGEAIHLTHISSGMVPETMTFVY